MKIQTKETLLETTVPMTSEQKIDCILEAAYQKSALEPVAIDVREHCSYTSYVVIVSARSERQVGAIAEQVLVSLKEVGVPSLGSEGKKQQHWALVDFGDVIVHVFHHPMRTHYNLEGLWADAKQLDIDIPEDAHMSLEDRYGYTEVS